MSPRYDVTIYAPFAAPLYATRAARPAGGAETQTWHLARGLAERGLRVCHVVFECDGLPAASGGIDLVTQPPDVFRRHFVTYTASMVGALRRADAAVYVQRTAGYETGVLAAFAKIARRRFVFSSSSLTDVSRDPPLVGISARSFSLGRRRADAIVVQTEDQHRLVRQTLGREARLIRSFCEAPAAREDERRAFLWIGGLIEYKGPEAYLALAERVPEARFWMVGTARGPEAGSLGDEVREAAARLPNVELLDERPRDELAALYAGAVAVVNTSRFEGFPNTFMEGWAHGAPALSLNVDPDGVIRQHGLGMVADGSMDALVAAARQLWEERTDAAPRATAARRYIAEHHDPSVVADAWVQLVEDLR